MRPKLLVGAFIFCALVAVSIVGCSPKTLTTDASTGGTTASDFIPLTASNWTVAYNGFGYVNFSTDGSQVEYAPQVSTTSGDTHAVLVLTNKFDTNPIANFRATIEVTTVSQLRQNDPPNAWETFWFFFNYKIAGNGKKETNYFTLKPYGYELGTAYNDIDQVFLKTGGSPTLTLGVSNTMVLEMVNGVLTVSIDGTEVFTYDNNIELNPMYIHAGNFGLYCEDAEVKVTSVKIESL